MGGRLQPRWLVVVVVQAGRRARVLGAGSGMPVGEDWWAKTRIYRRVPRRARAVSIMKHEQRLRVHAGGGG